MSGPETIRLDMPGWSNPSVPVLVYRGGVPVADAVAVEAMLESNAWPPGWRNGVYPSTIFTRPPTRRSPA